MQKVNSKQTKGKQKMDEDREAMLNEMVKKYEEENANLKEEIGELVQEKDRLISLLDDIQGNLSVINDYIKDYYRNRR